jgi:hypothetical protein
MSLKEFAINFNISFWSIFLGMICTFVGQGMIDRKANRQEVHSALELVRNELAANLEDINTFVDYLNDERKAVDYFLVNRTKLDKCPVDSVNYHSSMLFADAYITLSNDALELLKVSSLFQKIGNNQLSMDIIRAYDSCEYAVVNFNKFISDRDEQFKKTINEKSVSLFASTGNIDIKKFIKTTYGLYTIRWMSTQASPDTSYINDLEKAIKSIDGYLFPVRHYKNGKNR